MLSDRDLQELLHYQAQHPVMSVYLNTDPVEGNADAYRLRLRSMLKDSDLVEDARAVLRYFEHEHDWSGRSVAVFSCAPEGFFKAYPLAVPLRSRVRVGDQPFVKPLADLLDSYGGYGVVLVDKQGARFFYFHLGELQEQEGMMGEAIRHTKRGGGSQAPGRRGGVAGQTGYVDEVAERNMREAVAFATQFFAEKNVRRVLIGGTEDNIALFRSRLPKAWQSLVVGSFPISMLASHTEVLERAMAVGAEAERRSEARLAEALVTSASKGRGGVLHLEETLGALREGRVQVLLVREGFRAPGTRCTSCGYLSSTEMDVCPFCGGETEAIPDVVELAVRQVMETGGDVEVLAKDQSIAGFEQIGALLRY
jgi:peptide subunit release factor 1 (eRF1)